MLNPNELKSGFHYFVMGWHYITQKGLRPSFSKGAPPALANELYEYFIQKCGEKLPVSTGQFAADMQVSLINDGPVTFWLNI